MVSSLEETPPRVETLTVFPEALILNRAMTSYPPEKEPTVNRSYGPSPSILTAGVGLPSSNARSVPVKLPFASLN